MRFTARDAPATAQSWAEVTRSPWPAPAADARVAVSYASCGPDGALVRVATTLAEERARGHGAPDADHAAALLRVEGEPHVRPRVVVMSGRAPLDEDRVRAELGTVASAERRSRCGVAFARPEQGKELFVGVVVDALADLEPLPVRARTGEWLTLSATIHVPARRATVVVLGPRGLPRTVPTSMDPRNGRVRARFALDRPGAFTVQLVGDLEEGPRPLLEARVFADVDPGGAEDGPAPGEEAGGGNDDAAALARMTDALRESEALPPLARDERLDALARAHAERMRAARTIAHDLGDGDLMARFAEQGAAATAVGENVARARSVALAHRALHASPSHRMNLLRADYTHIGVGVAKDDAGDVYVCEVFAAGLR